MTGAAAKARPSPVRGPTLRLLLLETRDSPYRPRIEHAAREVDMVVETLDSLDAAPSDAVMIGVGPSIGDPLNIARRLRHSVSQPLLVFFAASSSARDALQAELIRDPFIYPRYELIEVPDNLRLLASRMGQVSTQIQRRALPRRPPLGRSHAATARPRVPAADAGAQDLANVLAHASEAIFSADDQGRILTWNQASERLLGIGADGAVGQPLSFLDSDDASAEQLSGIAQRVLDSGKAEHSQLTCRSPRGNVVRIAASIAPILDAEGTVLGVSLVARDDADFQRIEEALRDAKRQKDEFLAIMSHELRTPLTSILGYTDMLLRGLAGPLAPLTNKYIGNVRSAGDRLLDLVNGLLDYARLEAGAERLDPRPMDLSRAAGMVVQRFQPHAQSKRVDLRLTVGKGVPARIDADHDKVSHALRCILSNAIKFTPEGGWINVHIGPDPDDRESVRVSVSDSGIGMQAEALSKVWERFYQGDASLTRPYGGMGLGLSIAWHLVALHGGRVGAASSGPEQGSTFWFSLPVASNHR